MAFTVSMTTQLIVAIYNYQSVILEKFFSSNKIVISLIVFIVVIHLNFTPSPCLALLCYLQWKTAKVL